MTEGAAFDPATAAELAMVLGPAGAASLRRRFVDDLADESSSIGRRFAGGDAAGGRAAAHKLRGAALIVGASGVAHACGRLEFCDDDDVFDALEALAEATAEVLAAAP